MRLTSPFSVLTIAHNAVGASNRRRPETLAALPGVQVDLLAPRAALVFYSAVNVNREWRWPYRLVERLLLAGADGAHAPDHEVPPILRSKGFRSQPVSVIPLGVDVNQWQFAEPMSLDGIS